MRKRLVRVTTSDGGSFDTVSREVTWSLGLIFDGSCKSKTLNINEIESVCHVPTPDGPGVNSQGYSPFFCSPRRRPDRRPSFGQCPTSNGGPLFCNRILRRQLNQLADKADYTRVVDMVMIIDQLFIHTNEQIRVPTC